MKSLSFQEEEEYYLITTEQIKCLVSKEDLRTKILDQQCGSIDTESIQQVLNDHFDKPYSICTHPDHTHPPQEQGQTNLALIMDLTQKKFMVAKGPPCEHEYVDLAEAN